MVRRGDVRRGDGSIEERRTKSGEVRYQARWFDGTRWRAKTFATIEGAEDHLRSIGRARRGGRYTPDSELTVADLVREYIERGARRWSPNTVNSYQQILTGVIGPTIGSRRIVALTPRMVQTWIDSLITRYSPSRVEVIRAVLSGACREAVMLDVIPRNPTAGVRGPRVTRTQTVTWSAREAATVLEAVREDAELHAFYLVALTTGMRPGEMRALMWDDIDMARGIITVQRTVTRDANARPVIGTGTKSGRARTVAVPSETIAALARYRPVLAARQLRAEHWRDLGLVFPRHNGWLLPQQTIAKRHRDICERAGVPVITLHAMRHAFATILMGRGVHPAIVSQMLGHTKTGITLDTYSHVSDSMQRETADALGELLKDA